MKKIEDNFSMNDNYRNYSKTQEKSLLETYDLIEKHVIKNKYFKLHCQNDKNHMNIADFGVADGILKNKKRKEFIKINETFDSII
jgi:hypothetical protein